MCKEKRLLARLKAVSYESWAVLLSWTALCFGLFSMAYPFMAVVFIMLSMFYGGIALICGAIEKHKSKGEGAAKSPTDALMDMMPMIAAGSAALAAERARLEYYANKKQRRRKK